MKCPDCKKYFSGSNDVLAHRVAGISSHFRPVTKAMFWFDRPKTKREWTPQLTIPSDLHVKLPYPLLKTLGNVITGQHYGHVE